MIIHDFLDNDLYKFTVMNAIQKKFPDSEVVYRFVNRGNTSFPPGFADALREEVEAMAGVVLSKENEKFMRAKCYYFDSVFFDLLKGFRFNPAEVKVSQEGGKLDVEIRGLWYRTVLWEVPLMAMISELYFRMTGQVARDLERNATEKAKAFADIKAEISEFGTRRRYSFDVQDRVIGILKENMIRIGHGFDVHRFGGNGPCVLGGVRLGDPPRQRGPPGGRRGCGKTPRRRNEPGKRKRRPVATCGKLIRTTSGCP